MKCAFRLFAHTGYIVANTTVMESNNSKSAIAAAYDKAMRSIESCTHYRQLAAAEAMVENFANAYSAHEKTAELRKALALKLTELNPELS